MQWTINSLQIENAEPGFPPQENVKKYIEFSKINPIYISIQANTKAEHVSNLNTGRICT